MELIKNFTDCDAARSVLLPKVHKKELALRLIISHNKAIQPLISKY